MSLPPSVDSWTSKTLGIMFLLCLIAATGILLRPFIPALIWATLIVVATWPLHQRLTKYFGRPWLATAILVGGQLALMVLPLIAATIAIVQNTEEIHQTLLKLKTLEIPPPPPWIQKLPFVGAKIQTHWLQAQADGGRELMEYARPWLGAALKFLAGQLSSLLQLLILLGLTLVCSTIIYTHAESCATAVKLFFHRLAGQRGRHCVDLAGQALRAVAMGVVLTALAQTLLSILGLALADIPALPLLGGLTLACCLAQIGPAPVLIPATIWLFWRGETSSAILFALWSLGVMTVDNLLRPWLINMGAKISMLIIIPGVIGGLLSFGLVGLFLGPVILAVAWTLLADWTTHADTQAPQLATGPDLQPPNAPSPRRPDPPKPKKKKPSR